MSNFNDKFRNKILNDLTYRARVQHQTRKYEHCMEELKQLNANSVTWFSKLDTQKLAQAYDQGYRYGWMTTNIVECINRVLKGAQMLLITALVQLTFYQCVSYFDTHRGEIHASMRCGDMYAAYVVNKFTRAEAKASGHTVSIISRNNPIFKVITALHGFHMDKGHNKQVVKLNEGTCSCNKWQSFGISCSHVLVVCAHMRIDSWQFMDKYYIMDTYVSSYAVEFNPIPHENYWP